MQLPGEGLNGKLQLILINFSSLHSRRTHLPPPLLERKLCTCFWNRVHTACRNQSGQKDPFVQMLGICALIADSDHRGAERQAATVVAISAAVLSCPHLQSITSGGFRQSARSSLLFILHFSSFFTSPLSGTRH